MSSTAIAIDYVRSVWRARLFWTSLALLDLRKRYRRSALGVGWALVQPVAMATVICSVFVGAFQVGFAEHFPYVLIGLCAWNFLSTALREGCSCLYWSETYIRQHRAPLGVYPLRTVLSAAMHFAVALLPIAVWSLFMLRHWTLGSVVSLCAALPIVFLFAWGIATVAGIIAVYVADATQIFEVGLQLAFYGTPIIYRASMLRDHGHGWVIDWNPAAALIDAIRTPLLYGTAVPLWSLFYLTACAIVVWCLAAVLLVKFERFVIFRL